MAQVHFLKTLSRYYSEVLTGSKKFEFRKDDRYFTLGDFLILAETNDKTGVYTGYYTVRRISYILRNFPGIEYGYVVLSIENSDLDNILNRSGLNPHQIEEVKRRLEIIEQYLHDDIMH